MPLFRALPLAIMSGACDTLCRRRRFGPFHDLGELPLSDPLLSYQTCGMAARRHASEPGEELVRQQDVPFLRLGEGLPRDV